MSRYTQRKGFLMVSLCDCVLNQQNWQIQHEIIFFDGNLEDSLARRHGDEYFQHT